MTTRGAKFAIAFGALAIIALRMTIPSHGLTGWLGFVETIAHFWVGGTIVAAALLPRERRALLAALFAASLFELAEFLAQAPALL